jgi:hypothetical protein
VAEFAREFPLMSLVKLRIEIEREIRLLMERQAEAKQSLSIGSMLGELQRLDLAPQSVDRFRGALYAMNRAAHGFDVAEGDASQATEIATAFLAELRAVRDGSRP